MGSLKNCKDCKYSKKYDADVIYGKLVCTKHGHNRICFPEEMPYCKDKKSEGGEGGDG